MDTTPPARLSRGELAAGPPRTARWIAAAILAVPVLYFTAYLAVRGSHLVVHRISISGPLHQVVPGDDSTARRIVCRGPLPCAASTEVIPRLFAPLIWIETLGYAVGSL